MGAGQHTSGCIQFPDGQRYRSHRYKSLSVPYHQMDNQSQATEPDMVQLAKLYGSELDGIKSALPDDVDTLEIGVWLGSSSFFAAMRARQLSEAGERPISHWLIDCFGRSGLMFAGEPNMEVAFAHFRAEGLHNYCCWLPGTVETLGPTLADESFGAVFSGARHLGEWARKDLSFAHRVLKPGGLCAVHAMHGTGVYGDYDQVCWQMAEQFGWELLWPAPGNSSLNVFRKPG